MDDLLKHIKVTNIADIISDYVGYQNNKTFQFPQAIEVIKLKNSYAILLFDKIEIYSKETFELEKSILLKESDLFNMFELTNNRLALSYWKYMEYDDYRGGIYMINYETEEQILIKEYWNRPCSVIGEFKNGELLYEIGNSFNNDYFINTYNLETKIITETKINYSGNVIINLHAKQSGHALWHAEQSGHALWHDIFIYIDETKLMSSENKELLSESENIYDMIKLSNEEILYSVSNMVKKYNFTTKSLTTVLVTKNKNNNIRVISNDMLICFNDKQWTVFRRRKEIESKIEPFNIADIIDFGNNNFLLYGENIIKIYKVL